MKKTMVSAADYELYKILLPWKSLVSGVNALILGELEKRHPRFSGNCCYDTKYSLEKKKLMAEVVVMEKANLARYKQAGGILYLESERKRSIFCQKARFLRVATLILLVLSGIFSLRIAKSFFFAEEKSLSLVNSLSSESENAILSGEVDSGEDEDALLDGESLIQEVFSSVSRHGGKIASFSYTKKEQGEKFPSHIGGTCAFSVYACNSEDVVNAQYCVVSFKNNEPHFELELPFAENSSKKQTDVLEAAEFDDAQESPGIFSYEDELVAVASVRNALRSLGANIESEHNGEHTAEFAFSADRSILYSCLKVCAERAEKSLWREKTLSVTTNVAPSGAFSESGGICRVRVSFEKCERTDPTFVCGEILSLCARYAYLFSDELKIRPKKAKIFPLASPSPKKLVVKEKIGEVRRNDGAIFICYRNIDGKMTFETKELVNE